MSRAGFGDGDDTYPYELWERTVQNAITGKRGQKFLRELVAALDALQEKKLTTHRLRDETGMVCAIGAVCVRKGIDTQPLEPREDEEHLHWPPLASALNISETLVRVVEHENDERDECRFPRWTPEERWQHVRDWAQGMIDAAARERGPNK